MDQEKIKKSHTVEPATLFTEYDIYLFKQGNHSFLYEKLGSHSMAVEGAEGTYFAVWAPNAERVSVIGDFNNWDSQLHPLIVRGDHSGIWEGFIAGVQPGSIYKYRIVSRCNGYEINKGDPFAFSWEAPPKTASVVSDLQYRWADHDWMENRHKPNSLESPIAIYEMHFGSWRRIVEEGNRSLNYREMAHRLADYIKKMGFTHIELMPLMEHPFYGSWGYQTTGFFAPTRRYGTPQDFMYLIDYLHQHGIGVILDWVPSHFPSDEHGPAFFDGTHLYEHADPRKGFHPEWSSYIFNYGRNEVRSFLLSSAFFWLEKYHADGLRVDAVSSMLYLDYARKEGQWIPNEYGGRENIEAIHFLKRLNESIYEKFPDVQTIAEESTAWPMVTRPTYTGGLGFKMKWMMGWMHDNLLYFQQDPINRKYHHNLLTFSLWYAFTENYVLPLSHDEVVYGKGSMLGKMHGDEWQRFANLRLLYGFMYGHPGKKLLFMGDEFGQVPEWEHEKSLEWDVLNYPLHQGIQRWVQDLNRLYRSEPALYDFDFSPEGFEWIDMQDWEQSIVSFIRKGKTAHDLIMAVMNCTSMPRHDYRLGASKSGVWKEVLNSDASIYGGSGLGNSGRVEAVPIPCHGRPYSVQMTLPPLSIIFLKNDSTT